MISYRKGPAFTQATHDSPSRTAASGQAGSVPNTAFNSSFKKKKSSETSNYISLQTAWKQIGKLKPQMVAFDQCCVAFRMLPGPGLTQQHAHGFASKPCGDCNIGNLPSDTQCSRAVINHVNFATNVGRRKGAIRNGHIQLCEFNIRYGVCEASALARAGLNP